MIYNKNGEMFFYEDKMFIIGEEVFASESDYAGLLGRITEIRTGEDRDTENEGPDIYCNFQPPILNQDAELVSKMRFGNEDFSLDFVIMAPEMLMPTRYVGNGLPTVKVYAVVEDCMIDGEDHGETRLFSEKNMQRSFSDKAFKRRGRTGVSQAGNRPNCLSKNSIMICILQHISKTSIASIITLFIFRKWSFPCQCRC